MMNDVTTPDTPVKWNIVDETEFRSRVNVVFNAVASSLKNTLGPYGATTIIEKFGEAHITKDGWQVLKSIRFDNTLDNNILAMLQRISAQVVVKVGDGSTSSIIAASKILKNLVKHSKELQHIRPKELMELLNSTAEEIAAYIYKSAKKVDRETFDEIYKLAYISTNGNDLLANMIREIYVSTKNPTIEHRPSRTEKMYYEIIEGYKLDRARYLDPVFANTDDNKCVIKNPMILVFDHSVDMERDFQIIGAAAGRAINEKRRLVVVAPGYDKQVRDNIARTVNQEVRELGQSSVVYCATSSVNTMDKLMFGDFAIMAGAQIIQENFYDQYQLDDVENWVAEQYGEVNEITISSDDITITGLIKRNENIYKKVYTDAMAKYLAIEEESRSRSLIDTSLNSMRNRVSRLSGAMGIIHVGGYSSLEKTANTDLVDDAVKACESAYINGYNIGGNLIIPFTINEIYKAYEEHGAQIPPEKVLIMDILYQSFVEVFETVILNKYTGIGFDGARMEIPANVDDVYLKSIIDGCIRRDTPRCYDLINETFSEEIINSSVTDVEILKASISTIALILSSNQYLSVEVKR